LRRYNEVVQRAIASYFQSLNSAAAGAIAGDNSTAAAAAAATSNAASVSNAEDAGSIIPLLIAMTMLTAAVVGLCTS
jgi:hypothetical protein